MAAFPASKEEKSKINLVFWYIRTLEIYYTPFASFDSGLDLQSTLLDCRVPLPLPVAPPLQKYSFL
jgi:hypothetical protein